MAKHGHGTAATLFFPKNHLTSSGKIKKAGADYLHEVIVYTNTITPRLRFIFDFVGKEIGKENFFTLTSDITIYRESDKPKFNYSKERISENEFFLSPHAILFEQDIKQQLIACFETNDYRAFFKTDGDFPFDIFAASFYLLSRYEEYLPHQKDMYGRYAHENSLAYKENFLKIPLVNVWIKDLKEILKRKFPSPDSYRNPTGNVFFPTYDIDQAYSYKHKQFWRNAGGIAKSLFKLSFGELRERWDVMMGKIKDPFDAYQWMDQLHQRYLLKPYYFFIIAKKAGKYDKNIPPGKKAMQDLIRHHFYKYPVGIHPSWQSGDDSQLMKEERKMLESITGNKVVSSRQHYIRFTLPETFRSLIDSEIEFDFSMGYGSINGFRASVASAFYWFDLEKNEQTKLLLYPFCYMDANSYFEQHFSPQQAYDEMMYYYNTVKAVNGIMISIWHNSFLGTDKKYAGWKEAYEKFISGIASA